MRQHTLPAMFGLVFAGACLFAQDKQDKAAPPSPPPTGTPQQLAEVLTQWERAMAAVNTLATQCERTEVDKTWNRSEKYQGVAQYMKVPGARQMANYAILHMANAARETQWERFVCTGDQLYQYYPQAKELRVHTLPPPKPGQVANDNFLSFLFGMQAEEAKRRYEMTLLYPNDPNWIYLHVRARNDQDKADFQQARVVLDRKTLLPKQLWFEQPTGNHITWDLKNTKTDVTLDKTTFTTPETPAGWKVVKVAPRQADAPPRLVRPGQP